MICAGTLSHGNMSNTEGSPSSLSRWCTHYLWCALFLNRLQCKGVAVPQHLGLTLVVGYVGQRGSGMPQAGNRCLSRHQAPVCFGAQEHLGILLCHILHLVLEN